MAEELQSARIRGTVHVVENHWFRSGVPRRVRRRNAEQLEAQLVEAVEDGRSVDDVVGSDVPAFAAEWASVERRHPLVGLALQTVGAPALLIGALALVNPVLQLGGPQGQTGVPGWYVGLATLAALLGLGWQAIRIGRHRLSAKRAAGFELAALVLFGISLAAVFFGTPNNAFVTMAPATAGALVVVGGASVGLAAWFKHRRRDQRRWRRAPV